MAFKIPSFKPSTGAAAASAAAQSAERMPVNMKLQAIGGAAALVLVIWAIAAFLDYRVVSSITHNTRLSSDLTVLTQILVADAERALSGNQAALDALPKSRAETEQTLSMLEKNAAGISAAADADLNVLLPAAKRALQNVQEIESGRPGILAVAQVVKVANETGPALREATRQLAVSGVDSTRAYKFALLTERIGKDAASMTVASLTADQLAGLGSNILEAQGLLAGFDQANPAVSKVAGLFEGYRVSVEAIAGQAQGLLSTQRAMNELLASTSHSKKGPVFVHSRNLVQDYLDPLLGRATFYVQIAAGFILLSLLLLLSKVYLDDMRRRAADAERANRQNQDAILCLMDELSDLAEGDLTKTATVSENITGAIADAVNYTVEELRKLVLQITKATEQMGKATKNTEDIATGLLAASQKQEHELRNVDDSVRLITQSIKDVDSSAVQSADVARRTLEVTERGAQAVRNTISGMDGIREQIQETSKRIKRLGESSQEIGEIVDLISDITEQTNVLALNAAIQAVSAGEAGRGFSVVAEEVQRLAERSAEATKQIGALVKTIQSDTQNAVAAMEKSTLGVVEGTKLSDVAGQSLHEIEQVSNELAGLINSISVSTQVQNDIASEVATVMQDVLLINRQTTDGTRLTANAVAQLNSLSSDLKSSVAGFKL